MAIGVKGCNGIHGYLESLVPLYDMVLKAMVLMATLWHLCMVWCQLWLHGMVCFATMLAVNIGCMV
jgi:hypothetical protein